MNKKAYRQQLLEILKEFLDTSKIDMNTDFWDIDKFNHMGVEVFDSGSIVYFSDTHQHFWEHDSNEDYDFIVETAIFIKELLAGQTQFERSYRGKKLIRVAYYTKNNDSEEWVLQQDYVTALFRTLFRFPKKVIQTEIIEFRQQ